jgi:NtrC-family two-component system sensor histidine kinase KinB
MSLRAKLTVGLGFLFLIIFGLVVYASYEIHQLSKASDNILKDNYASLVYCKNMLLALDDMNTTISGRIFGSNQNRTDAYGSQLFASGQSTFDHNLRAEKNNITEIHEGEYVAELEKAYGLFLNLSKQITEKGGNLALYFSAFLPAASEARQIIVKIDELNMQAVERKSQSTKGTAAKMVISMGVVGTIGIILAFFYFWYFPFYVSNSISYLTKRMKALLQDIGIKIDATTKDESLILLHSINLLENKITNGKKETKRRKA